MADEEKNANEEPEITPEQRADESGASQDSSEGGVKQAIFDPLTEDQMGSSPVNINFLMDISLDLTIELGRAVLNVKDILNLKEGSVVELNKLAGDAVDIYVNNKLIAHGEVVVIDDNFGVRVTDILSPSELLNNLKKED